VTDLSWGWIGVQLTAPPIGGFLAAWPIWRMGQSILGNIAGTIVIFGSAIALILREHVELDAAVQACLAQNVTCWPDPSAFTRYAIYASIGLIEVMALFTLSLRVESNYRRRGYAPEWR
jgi:hypothetical protein